MKTDADSKFDGMNASITAVSLSGKRQILFSKRGFWESLVAFDVLRFC